MSSGSNAPRKPNVAASASSPFKASSRFLHGGVRNGPGAGSKGMKRQRAGASSFDREVLSAESNNNLSTEARAEVSRCFALEERKESSSGGVKSKKRFVGVRQRPSGRWVAEIKDTTQKIRLWLGTFDSAEEGAKAYDSAARALRGANTRTNFVPAMACEGTVPASKAARLIRLRQIAAASKACEEEKGADHPNLTVESSHLENHSPSLVRQDFQQSISSLDPLPSRSPADVDDHTSSGHLPSSPPKPARLIGRRHNNAPLASATAKPSPQEDDAPPGSAAVHDHGTVDNDSPMLDEVDTPSSPPKLEPQLSITSDNLSIAVTHSPTAGSPQECSSSPPLTRVPWPPPLRLPSPRSPFECMQQPMSVADGVQSVSSFVEATDHWKSCYHGERFTTFAAFSVDTFVAPVSPIPFHVAELEASRQSDLVEYPHQISSCATNRDHVSMYAATTSEKDQEVICGGRSFQRTLGHQLDDDAMNLDVDEKQNRVDVTETKCGRASMVVKADSMDHYGPSSEMYRTELAESNKHGGCILREREFAVPEIADPELVVPEIPWPDYVLMDEMGMETGLLGLDLSCENSGVYASAFDFSAEAIDRDSCTSGVLLEEHLSDDSKFFRSMQYEQSSTPPACQAGCQDFQECVLLTEPPELEYALSPHEPGAPQLSPHETTTTTTTHSLQSMSSSPLWRLDDTTTTTWDGQSSGSTESTTDVKPPESGECTSSQVDHEALWSSMDLPPLCMVAYPQAQQGISTW